MKDDLINRVLDKVEKIDDKLDSMDRTLIKQEENLREHMRRTELLENQHVHLEDHVHNELEPVKAHVQQVKGVSKFLAVAIPILIAAAGAAYKYLVN